MRAVPQEPNRQPGVRLWPRQGPSLYAEPATSYLSAGVTGDMGLFRQLYVQVLIGILLAVALGLAAPQAALAMKPLGDAFIALLKRDGTMTLVGAPATDSKLLPGSTRMHDPPAALS